MSVHRQSRAKLVRCIRDAAAKIGKAPRQPKATTKPKGEPKAK